MREQPRRLAQNLSMVMVRLKVEDLADQFYVSPATVSRIFISWINLMYVKFKEDVTFQRGQVHAAVLQGVVSINSRDY